MRSQLTSGRLSTMELINPKDVYKIGDEVFVRVKTRNQLNRPKRRGGDYLKARMFTDVVAASTPGEITDHKNGTYTVRFRAGWSGKAAVQVHVIHPREAIDVLRRLRDVERKRVNACSFVQEGSTEWTRCWTTPSRDPGEEECDFSHAPSGTDWYCKKPVRAPCSAIDKCSGGGLRPLEEIGVTETDKMLFNETFIDQAVMEGTILWVQVTEQDVPCVIRHGSGNCLYASDPDVDGSDPLRRRVVLWPCTDSVRQVFALRHDGKIVHVYSGLCVSVIDDNSTDHGQIVLRNCESGGLRFRRTDSRAIQDVTTLRCLHPHPDVQVPLDGSPVRLAEGYLSGSPKCEPGHPPSAGFYLHDNWYTYACRARQFPDRDSVIKCLTNKSVYMYGDSTVRQRFDQLNSYLGLTRPMPPDSTVRQWFDHLNSYLGLTRLTLLPDMENCHIGPCGSHHNSTNTHLHMMFHNFPIYGNPFKYHRMIYIADELDRLQGGPDVVVVITIWFHFLMEPVHIYRKRIVAIRDAILRLHQVMIFV
ncbi:NXPE family member 3-like [Branchiostoma floridae]|uniref:NXPE family member 3-like n=1 Tax=Branchiostoma floridae TaxID=7739 RepID=A0A9J7LGU1_BRAFL|nr:NXPE family member 3-like [Branchiostoma floridae]